MNMWADIFIIQDHFSRYLGPISCEVDELLVSSMEKIAFFRALAPVDARGTLEREAGAKNSDFRVIIGINRLSMERGIR